ncbi:formylmethanofuran dehydrogenase, subunit B [Variovorax paradoxus B4]|uniref:Formylmethanofuran dehydrogenase, subunit B n=1 Tax=Variovorax paradoxus B4 TaxID=1246301 RepID=T1XCL4_VARPD|nr:formylmethanofuran dehydrogenase subunit B [Variovorax paradoxus]AGU50221.1 formylmethanofuran dehydrogenase, subunit B [Variovorax paradoxus B4]
MNEPDTAALPGNAPWTCPFCPLLCDTFGVELGTPGTPLKLVGSDCPRARNALANFDAAASAGRPRVDGQDCDLDTALGTAASLLAASRQPLFGGLGTDVAGARALYALACETGAICDPAQGQALMHGLRALQDRGGFSTTLAEVRTRADLIVCMTEEPAAHYPELLRRFGVGEREDVAVETLPPHGDLFDTVALLAALVAGRISKDDARVPADLAALSARLKAARYAVLVYESGRLPAQGALIVEAIQRIVATLNRSTRAASLPLGGGDGASTVNQVFAWLSGLPLRSRAGPLGLEHEPLCFDAQRLLVDGAVDTLLWVSSYGPEPAPPPAGIPRIVLGHPGMQLPQDAHGLVFIPVSTPGIGSAGHLFRTDGSVLLPLRPVYEDGLPSVGEVVRRLTQAVQALKKGHVQ